MILIKSKKKCLDELYQEVEKRKQSVEQARLQQQLQNACKPSPFKVHPSKKIVSSEPKVSVFKRIRGSISPTFKQKADSSTNEKAKSRKSSDSLSEKPVSKSSSNKSVASRKRKRQKENASVSKSKYQKICENNERNKSIFEEDKFPKDFESDLDEKDTKRDSLEDEHKKQSPDKQLKPNECLKEIFVIPSAKNNDLQIEAVGDIELMIKNIEISRREYYNSLGVIKHEVEIQKALFSQKTAYFDYILKGPLEEKKIRCICGEEEKQIKIHATSLIACTHCNQLQHKKCVDKLCDIEYIYALTDNYYSWICTMFQ